jgi:hypothetical protein
LLVYDGRTWLGAVRRLRTRRFLALDPDGKRIGTFETQLAAVRALPPITTTPANRMPGHRVNGAGPKQEQFNATATYAHTKDASSQ